MKKILTFSIFIFLIVNLHAQNKFTISGSVVDASRGEEIIADLKEKAATIKEKVESKTKKA